MSVWMTPEHLHVVLNHLPLVGLGASLIPLVVAVVMRQRAMLVVGLGMCLLFAGSMPLVMWTGEGAMERLGNDEVAGPLDSDGFDWMLIHEERAHKVAWLVYVAAALAAAGLICAWKRPTWMYRVGIAVALVGLLSLPAVMWVAEAGGKIRHPEFRGPKVEPVAAQPIQKHLATEGLEVTEEDKE